MLDFEAAWTLTMQNLRRNIREPLRPEEVLKVSRSAEFRAARQDDGRRADYAAFRHASPFQNAAP